MHNPIRRVFDSGGALFRQGRWNSESTRVLYAAQHISLAALEILVHAEGTRIPPRVVTEIHIPDCIEVQTVAWMELHASQEFGDTWVRDRRSAVLRVPSIVAHKLESNFVINPAHQDFAFINEGISQPFVFDERFIHFQ